MNNSTNEAIGRRIKEVANKNGCNLRELAGLIGVTAATTSRYANGTRAISLESLIKISAEFGVSTDYLLKGTRQTETKER